MPENTHSQHHATEQVEQIITGESGRDSDEVVVGEVEEPFSEESRYARIPKGNLARGLIQSGDAGHGKSTSTINLLLQLAFDGHGFCYLDTRGEDVVGLLQRLPEDRLEDVVLVGGWGRYDTEIDAICGIDLLETPEQKDAPEEELFSAILQTLNLDDLGLKTLRSLSSACAVASELDKPLSRIQEVFEMGADEFDEMDLDVSESTIKWITDVDIYSDEMSPVLRRTQELGENPVLQSVFSPDGASLYDAVANDQIVIWAGGVEPREVKQIIATGVFGKLYDVLQSGLRESRDSLYPVVIDDMDRLDIPSNLIETYTDIARPYQAPLIGTIQYPAQLPNEDRNAFFSKIDNWLCFADREPQSANEIVSRLGFESRDQLMNLPPFVALSKLEALDGKFTGEVQTFPPIKPRRPEESVEEVVLQSDGD